MPRPFPTQVPLLTGKPESIQELREIIGSSHHELVRTFLTGDSRRTTIAGGRYFMATLNAMLAEKFGFPSESPVLPTGKYVGGEPPAMFLGHSNNLDTAPETVNTSNYLPSFGASDLTGTIYGALHSLMHTGEGNQALEGRQATYFNPGDGGLIYEAWFIAHAGSCDECEIRVSKHATKDGHYGGTTIGTYTSTDLDLSTVAAGTVVRFETPAITYDAALPYLSANVRGWDGAALATGLRMIGGRWRKTSATKSNGMVVTSFSAGGYSAATHTANHANAGPCFNAFGPWRLGIISLGANHSDQTADVFKAEIQGLIDLTRGATWANDPNLPILLVADEPRSAVDADQRLQQNQFPAVLSEIAQRSDHMTMMNVTGAIIAEGNPLGYTDDDVHARDRAQAAWADLWFRILTGQYTGK